MGLPPSRLIDSVGASTWGQARVECQSHRLSIEDAPTPEYMASQIGAIQQKYTQRGGVRPFGIASLLAGFTTTGTPQLWHTDPTGVYSRWAVRASCGPTFCSWSPLWVAAVALGVQGFAHYAAVLARPFIV